SRRFDGGGLDSPTPIIPRRRAGNHVLLKKPIYGHFVTNCSFLFALGPYHSRFFKLVLRRTRREPVFLMSRVIVVAAPGPAGGRAVSGREWSAILWAEGQVTGLVPVLPASGPPQWPSAARWRAFSRPAGVVA